MRMRPAIAAVATIAIGISILCLARAADEPVSMTEDETAKIAIDTYIYGFPLVLMDVSRQVMTAVPKPTTTAAPINQFNVSEAFPDATFTSVVSPNADTLYSFAWLDLSKEPLVLSLPDTGDRYYLMQMLDGWTNVFRLARHPHHGQPEGRLCDCRPELHRQAAGRSE